MFAIFTVHTIGLALTHAKAELIDITTTPDLDSELLLALVLQVPRSYLHAYREQILIHTQNEAFADLIKRRLTGEPIAYILGWKEFWSLKLQVTPNVLIPREETELLVELVLQELSKDRKMRVVDLGTGSGAIALALASMRSNWEILATDLYPKALQVAHDNAKILGISNVNFYQGDWCLALPAEAYDAIIANPPYIQAQDLHLNKPEMKFEPREALIADGDDGLGAIRIIVAQAKLRLRDGGWLFLEHGFDQGRAVEQLLIERGYTDVSLHHDLAGFERVTKGRC